MSWLIDNANTVYLLLIIGILGFVAAWRLNQRAKFLVVAAGLLVVILLFWLLTRFVITDRRQIELNVQAMADATAAGNVDALFKHFTTDLKVQRHDVKRDALRAKTKGVIEMHKISEVRIREFDVTELAASRAKANFKAYVSGADGQVLAVPWCVTEFVNENGAWKLNSVEFRNAIANTDQLMPVPLP